jgi:carbon-monoxide dehydrogenase small subunit
MSLVEITLTVNGEPVSAHVEPRLLLSDFLRDDLGLTGTHVGCEHGVCGACTVLVHGRTARACLLFAVQLDGQTVETVESLLLPNGDLSPVQSAFRDHHGLQCGFCTSGMLMTAVELLRNGKVSDKAAIRDAISGNLCRCTGYETIVDAIAAAAMLETEPSA